VIERKFPTALLAQWGLPHGGKNCAAEILRDEITGSQRWATVNELIFRAPDDGHCWQVFYEYDTTGEQLDVDPWNYEKSVTATRVELREVVVRSWVPVRDDVS